VRLAKSIEARLVSLNRHLTDADTDSNTVATRVFSPIPINYQEWRVNYSEFDELKQIGGCVSAFVFYGRSKKTQDEVAIKKFKFQKLNG
jgi:hypothetical protein